MGEAGMKKNVYVEYALVTCGAGAAPATVGLQ
jgi:hypothetical protein